MSRASLLLSSLMGFAASSIPNVNPIALMSGLPTKRRRSKNIPEKYYGYSGAKLARKAFLGQVAVKHI